MARFPLVIALPLEGRQVEPEWALSMWALNRPLNMNNTILPVKGMERGAARTALCRKARSEFHADYILMVDDDTAPPTDGLLKLLFALQNAPPEFKAAAGIYCSKTSPPSPLIFQTPGEGPCWNWTVGDIFECTDFIATGFMLIRADVFDTLPEPWFRDVSSFEEAQSLGMSDGIGVPGHMVWDLSMTDDAFFCRKLRQHGYRILAHGGVLPIHWRDGQHFTLPEESFPCQSFYRKEAKARNIELEKALAIEGWMNFSELSWLAEQARTHKAIVELGSFKGRSTRALCDNTEGVVFAIDDWIGPRNTEYTGKIPDCSHLREDFDRNLEGVNGKLKVITSDHKTATAPVSPDMVFIDGSHEYEDVKHDILMWRNRLLRGGLLCGHDIDWPGVKQAVTELIPEYKVAQNTNIWFKEC